MPWAGDQVEIANEKLPPTHPGIKFGSPLPIGCFWQRSSTILFFWTDSYQNYHLSRMEDRNGVSSELKVQRMRYTEPPPISFSLIEICCWNYSRKIQKTLKVQNDDDRTKEYQLQSWLEVSRWIATKVAQDACHAKSNSGPTDIIYQWARCYFISHKRNSRNF